ncbi:hypothetical protein [Streptomyces sp. NPDC052693]|uniref:hypothetical protein n=1 Tax=Streptomyces sp. NPDC052693 TaxID=3155814 RepID=UPI003443196E
MNSTRPAWAFRGPGEWSGSCLDPPGPPPPHGHLRRSPRAPTPAHTHEVTIARCQGPDAPRALVEVKVKVVVTETW